MDQDTKDAIIGLFIFVIIILVISFFIYAVFIHEPSDDSWLEPKDQYTYYIDMYSHSKLDEYLIDDKAVRVAFKTWSDINDISFIEVNEISDNYQLARFTQTIIEPQLPDIIIFFSQTPHTYGTAGQTRCYNTYCTIEIIMGHHDCNNKYRLYDYNKILHTIKHEIGHIIGVFHIFDTNHLMFGIDFTDNFNPRNLTIPDYKESYVYNDYSYDLQRNQTIINYELLGMADIMKHLKCINTPPFLSYDWFVFEIQKIYWRLTYDIDI